MTPFVSSTHSSSIRAALLALTAFAATSSLAPATFAQAPGDISAGKKVTEFLCRSCHDISGSERSKSPPGGAPAFFDVAQSSDTTAEKLHKYLRLPHGRMTNVLLTGREIDDAVAYIMSFKRK